MIYQNVLWDLHVAEQEHELFGDIVGGGFPKANCLWVFYVIYNYQDVLVTSLGVQEWPYEVHLLEGTPMMGSRMISTGKGFRGAVCCQWGHS